MVLFEFPGWNLQIVDYSGKGYELKVGYRRMFHKKLDNKILMDFRFAGFTSDV